MVKTLLEKCDYDEQEELKKENWRDLQWTFVSPKVINEMVKKGLDVNDKVIWWVGRRSCLYTPLHFACQAGNLQAVKALLQKGANPNVKGGYDYPTREKVRERNVLPIDLIEDIDIAHCLIQHGAKVSAEKLERIKKIADKKSPAKNGRLKEMLTLASKEKALDRASEKQRKAREGAVAKAEKAGKPLSKEEVKKLRDSEGRARARAYKGMLEQRFGKSGK